MIYSNPQRCLECLQRALKLADACTTANPADLKLFVDLLDHYLFFFEKNNPSITGKYLSGLVALVQEHLAGDVSGGGASKAQFHQIVSYIRRKKESKDTEEKFADIDVSGVST